MPEMMELKDKGEIEGIKLELRRTGTDTREIEQYSQPQPVYKYSLLVKNEHGQERFSFWGSIAGYQGEVTENEPEEPSVYEVFEAVLSDSISYINARDIDEFADELGYTKVSETIEAWEGCEETATKLREKLRIPEGAVFSIANRLRDLDFEKTREQQGLSYKN